MPGYNKDKFTLSVFALLALLAFAGAPLHAEDDSKGPAPAMSEDVSRIVDRLLAAEAAQQEALQDVTLDGMLYERRLKGDGDTKEEKRFDKTVYFLRRDDSARYWNVSEVFHSFEKNGEEQEEKKLKDEVKDKLDKQKKGRRNDKGRPITDVFLPRFREHYSYNYAGIVDTPINGFTCHLIEVRAWNPKDEKERLNADFYIDTTSARPVFVEFAPAKLGGGLMFKFKEMSMNLTFKQIDNNVWFPERFYMWGKAKAGIFFTVRFEVEELYSNPRINTGLDADLFTESMSYATTDGATSQ